MPEDERQRLSDAWDAGFHHALAWYGSWKDGVQYIGCQNTPIKDATPCVATRKADIELIDERSVSASPPPPNLPPPSHRAREKSDAE